MTDDRSIGLASSAVPGDWKPIQCIESGPVTTFGSRSTKVGPLSGIRCCHVDIAALLLYACCALACVHLVLYRTLGC